MKKIFIIVGLFLFFPINAFASECTQEMIDSYLPQANQVSLTYQATTNPDTYMIYVNELTAGISFNGINGAAFDNGFYAYAQAGETFTISIRISDGSVCALQELKKILYGSTLMDTENRVAHKMTKEDHLIMNYLQVENLYKELMKELTLCRNIEELFYRDYKDFSGFGFSVIKIIEKNKDIINEETI